MKNIVLQYDTVLTANPLAYSITCQALNIDCQLAPENLVEFYTADDSLFMTTISRMNVTMQLSSMNFIDNDAALTSVMAFLSAPVRRIQLITDSSTTSINGFTQFNVANTINMNVESHNVNFTANRKYRNVDISLISERKHTI